MLPTDTAGGSRLAVLCVLLALAAWSGTLVRSGFAFDDAEALRGNPVVEGRAPWQDAFARDYWDHVAPAGHYRPLATLSLRLDHALFGPDSSVGWHATNVALHAATVALLAVLLLLLGPHGARAEPLPWLGVALFAVHPALADSVAWISGRSSMISAGAGVAGAALIVSLQLSRTPDASARAALTALFAALGLLGALLGKEDGAVFAALYVLLGARVSRRTLAAALLGSATALVAYLALRAQALGSPWPSAPHAPLAGEALGDRLLVSGRALVELERLAVAPLGYPPSYDRSAFLDPGTLPVPAGWMLLAVLGWLPWLAAMIAGGRSALRNPHGLLGWSALLAALSLVPVLQLVPAGTILAPRFLYLPLLLAAPCVHAAWTAARPALPRWLPLVLLAAAVVGAWHRAGVYASRASYHEAVLVHRPADAPAWNEIGLAREEHGDLPGARAAFERAAALDPGYSRPWSNLGRLALEAGEIAQAERCLRRAVELGPGNARARSNLGALLLRLGRPEEAIEPYRRACALAPRFGGAWRGLGRALLESGRSAEAAAALERALTIDPGDDRARALLDSAAGS